MMHKQQKYGENVLVQVLEKRQYQLGDRKMGIENDDESLILIKGFYYVNHT